MANGFEINLSPSVISFFRENTDVPKFIRLKLLNKCLALRENPTPKGHTIKIVNGEKLYKLTESGTLIGYSIDKRIVTILVILIDVNNM